MKLFSVTYPAAGCDPESDNYTLFRDRPDDDNGWLDVREWEVDDDAVPLYALCKITARCCGTGHLFDVISAKEAFLKEMAAVLNGGPMTNSEYERLEEDPEYPEYRTQAYCVMGPLEVLDREDTSVPPDDALLWNTTTSVSRMAWELGLDDDVFIAGPGTNYDDTDDGFNDA